MSTLSIAATTVWATTTSFIQAVCKSVCFSVHARLVKDLFAVITFIHCATSLVYSLWSVVLRLDKPATAKRSDIVSYTHAYHAQLMRVSASVAYTCH